MDAMAWLGFGWDGIDGWMDGWLAEWTDGRGLVEPKGAPNLKYSLVGGCSSSST